MERAFLNNVAVMQKFFAFCSGISLILLIGDRVAVPAEVFTHQLC